MATYQTLPGNLQVQITTIFTPANFCFLTSDSARTPTFYFARGGVAQLSTATLCGRLRTMHNHGPLIDITTTRKRHFFFERLHDRDTVRGIMQRMTNQQLTNGDARFFMDLIGRIYGTVPKNWNFHYEYTVPAAQPDRVSRRHPSGGRVHLSPRPTQNQIVRLIDRLLADNCAITVDRTVVQALGVQAPRPAVFGVAAYLNSL